MCLKFQMTTPLAIYFIQSHLAEPSAWIVLSLCLASLCCFKTLLRYPLHRFKYRSCMDTGYNGFTWVFSIFAIADSEVVGIGFNLLNFQPSSGKENLPHSVKCKCVNRRRKLMICNSTIWDEGVFSAFLLDNGKIHDNLWPSKSVWRA